MKSIMLVLAYLEWIVIAPAMILIEGVAAWVESKPGRESSRIKEGR